MVCTFFPPQTSHSLLPPGAMRVFLWLLWRKSKTHIDGSVQERRNLIANTPEIHDSCINPSICRVPLCYSQHFLPFLLTDFTTKPCSLNPPTALAWSPFYSQFLHQNSNLRAILFCSLPNSNMICTNFCTWQVCCHGMCSDMPRLYNQEW